MASYILTNKAVQDISGIWQYTADTWTEKQADKYYFMLLDTCQDLANEKVTGRKYPEIKNEILGFRAAQHIIFYRKLREGKIEITRILHMQMDLRNRLRG